MLVLKVLSDLQVSVALKVLSVMLVLKVVQATQAHKALPEQLQAQ